MSPERIWYGRGLGPSLLRAALTPLSGLYWLGWQSYLGVYKIGLKRPEEPHRPVICVGNLVAGGSGKTPAAIHLAKCLVEAGREVVVSASGYGTPASRSAAIAPEGEIEAHNWGDEPAMIRWALPEIPLIVGRDRVRAAALCHERYPGAVLLLDDGLQHLPLTKHIQICLTGGGDNRLVLPGGPYREPRSSLRRMDITLDTKCDPSSSTKSTASYALCVESTGFLLNGLSPAEAPRKAIALCALARPQRFVDSLVRQGVEIIATRFLSDHDPMSVGDLFQGLPARTPLIVTAKDWVKLRQRDDTWGHTIFVAMQEARIEPSESFLAWLTGRLGQVEGRL